MSGMNIVGVQFRNAGKMYDFSCGDLELRVGDYVVVDTDRGYSLAQVIKLRYELEKDLGEREIKPILRRATSKEMEKKSRLSEEEVNEFTRNKVKELKLDMRVLQCEIQFGGNKVIVYFTAPGRVDFRELVKELAGGLKTRVELKQVGARDETKILGGVGICGRQYCCSSFLREFVPVSIRMAKNQNLALNPAKVSGGCGRLLCCLTYEDDIYTELRRTLPPKGTKVRILERGDLGTVLRCDVINQLLLVNTENGQQLLVPIKELEVLDKGTSTAADEVDDWGDDLDLALLVDDNETGDGAKKKAGQRPRKKFQGKKRPQGVAAKRPQDGEKPQGTQAKAATPKKPRGGEPQQGNKKPTHKGGPKPKGGQRPKKGPAKDS